MRRGQQVPNPASDQYRRFIETARELGCDEDEAAFDEKLRRIATAKLKPALDRPARATTDVVSAKILMEDTTQMTDIEGKGWKNSGGFPSGNAGYGIQIPDMDDRRRFPRARRVELRLDGVPHPIFVNTDKKSFWTPSCGELISTGIGAWMRSLEL
jgi:hypothetical protein